MKTVVVLLLIFIWLGVGLYYLAVSPLFGIMFTLIIGGLFWLGLRLWAAAHGYPTIEDLPGRDDSQDDE